MANYTVELRDIVEHGINIFDFPYDFYSEEKKRDFENKFIKHFYFREIGCETVERFKWYLEDKMNTVFPYYNELLKSATIKYDVLDNYKLTETYTRNVENVSKQHGISSTVGQALTEQESETKQNKLIDTSSSTESTGSDNETETGNTTINDSGTNTTINNESTNVQATKETTNTGSTSQEDVKKFLDTPQGSTNLSNSNYLTSINQDTSDGSQTTQGSETGTDKRTLNATSENETTNNSETENTRTATKNATFEQENYGTETTVDTINGNVHSEQKTTTDNNTKMFNDSQQKEEYTITRRGNIGVDTDSDAIEKHNRLQKTLSNIERMFFDECEDLFMLVY